MVYEYNDALISINATMVVQLLSFLFFLFVFNRLMIQPLRRVMTERDEALLKAESSVAQAKEEMERMTRELAEQEGEARKESSVLAKNLENEGAQEAKRILEEARKKIEGARRETMEKVEAEIDKARSTLEEESRTLAVPIMEKILGRSIG